jgi:hypothetical protein
MICISPMTVVRVRKRQSLLRQTVCNVACALVHVEAPGTDIVASVKRVSLNSGQISRILWGRGSSCGGRGRQAANHHAHEKSKVPEDLRQLRAPFGIVTRAVMGQGRQCYDKGDRSVQTADAHSERLVLPTWRTRWLPDRSFCSVLLEGTMSPPHVLPDYHLRSPRANVSIDAPRLSTFYRAARLNNNARAILVHMTVGDPVGMVNSTNRLAPGGRLMVARHIFDTTPCPRNIREIVQRRVKRCEATRDEIRGRQERFSRGRAGRETVDDRTPPSA